MTGAKICGLTTADSIATAIAHGAAFIGLVAYPTSPRHVSPLRAAAVLEQAGLARDRPVKVVAVTVNADDALLKSIADWIAPDLVQLHGSETPEQAARARQITGAGIIKALAVSTPDDLEAAAAFEPVADYLMFDARTPPGTLPGGMGLSFDWSMLAGRRFGRPWFLAGGLNPGNVAQAVRATGAPLVDVSSGVESAPGVKDLGLIADFLRALKDV